MPVRSPRHGSAFQFFLVLGIILTIVIAAALRIWLGLPFWVVYLAGVNSVTICAYLFDKSAARQDWRRVPENVMHLLALGGGSPAAAFSQAMFRHKTVKRSFRRWFWAIVALQIALILIWLYYGRPRITLPR